MRRFFALMIGVGLLTTAAGCSGGDLGSTLGLNSDETPAPSPSAATPAPTPTPIPEATPTPTKVVMTSTLRRNLAFDMQRSRGITQVYEGKPRVAVDTFHTAQHMKPDDTSIEPWLKAINKALTKPRANPEDDGVYTVSPRGSESGGQGTGPGTATAGATPTPRPSGPTPGPIDPRMIF